MTIYKFFAVALLALASAACGGAKAPEPPTAGELKEVAALCDKANGGKRVAVVGYPRFPEKFSGTSSVVLRLYEKADYAGQPVGVQTPIGKQANQVELAPKSYTDKDLKVHTADGQVAGYGTKVRVSGKMYFPLVGQDFKCSLENPLIESAR